MSFQPSEYSGINAARSAVVSMPTAAQLGGGGPSGPQGAYGSYAGDDSAPWYHTTAKALGIDKFFGTKEMAYGPQEGDFVEESPSDSSSSSASGPKTGSYAEGGYAYYYSAKTGGIRIIASPHGTTDKSVAKGSPAYKAILTQIKSGVAKPISNKQAKEMRGASSQTRQVGASGVDAYRDVTSSSSGGEVTPAGAATPFYQKPWFIPLAAAGAVLMIGAAVILAKD